MLKISYKQLLDLYNPPVPDADVIAEKYIPVSFSIWDFGKSEEYNRAAWKILHGAFDENS